MIYIEYEVYKNKFYETQKRYNDILNEKEALFSITQPSSFKYDGEPTEGGLYKNVFDEYLMLKEKKNIDQRLEEIKRILEDRKKLLDLKEEELKSSTDNKDKIYKYRFIDGMKVHQIARAVIYSEPQVYRILKEIKMNIKKHDKK